MIDEVVMLLRDVLNAHVKALSTTTGDSIEDEVVLIEGDKLDPVTFKSGAVSALMINVEADNTLPRADPFRRVLSDGSQVPVAPEIRLNLYLLFVARYKQYDRGLARLSAIIQFFQSHRVLDQQNTPALSAGLDKLIIEMVTVPFSEQNEIWGALRSSYHPSLLYRVRMVTIATEDAPPGPQILEVVTSVSQ